MLIDFDSAKDKLNFAKHKLSLGVASTLEWDEALVWIDERFEYDELRLVALIPEGNTLYYVTSVKQRDIQRGISLRYANRSEIKHYVENHT